MKLIGGEGVCAAVGGQVNVAEVYGAVGLTWKEPLKLAWIARNASKVRQRPIDWARAGGQGADAGCGGWWFRCAPMTAWATACASTAAATVTRAGPGTAPVTRVTGATTDPHARPATPSTRPPDRSVSTHPRLEIDPRSLHGRVGLTSAGLSLRALCGAAVRWAWRVRWRGHDGGHGRVRV